MRGKGVKNRMSTRGILKIGSSFTKNKFVKTNVTAKNLTVLRIKD